MPIKISVEAVEVGKGVLEQTKRNAAELNAQLKNQFNERRKIIELQAKLSQAASRDEKAAIRSEIAERRRGLQLASLQEREEKAVTRELKQQISSQQRLNRLTEKLNKDLAEEQRKRSLLGRAQAALGGGAGGALAIGGAIASSQIAQQGLQFARESIELHKQQAAVEAQLEARLRSTGGAAGLTSGELKNLARELQSVTNVGDEATIAAEAMLASFTNIGKETFPRATKAILDTATAMNNGATPSAEQLKNMAVTLGKALNEPETGFTRLERQGILLTDQQKEQIKTMAEAGDVAGAQAVILAELEKEFGGSAEAARKADGGFIALTNSIGDFKEAVGAAITPSGEFNDLLIHEVDSATNALNALTLLAQAHNKLNETGNKTTDMLTKLDTFARAAQNPVAALNLFIGEGSDNTEKWTQALVDAENEQKSGVKAANDLSEAFDENTAATNENSDAQEEAAKRLEHVQSVERDFAKNLLDITETSTKDKAEQWQGYYKDLDELATDHSKRVADIEEKAGKERISIGKKLAKDLAKLDNDLARDREKTNADTQKKIKRLQEDANREQKQDRRKRQIDTAGDERLFNFELQNLAAEGEALQIEEAKKRREIEKQIAAEKSQEDQQQQSSDLDVKIERLKQDAQDQLRQEEAQARERREFLKTQADEDRQQLAEQLQEQKDAETENLQERLDKLKEANAEKLHNIEETRQEAIKKLGEELAEAKDLTTSQLNELKPVAAKVGEDVGGEFAQGLRKGFETNRSIEGLLEGLQGFSGGAAGRKGGSRGAAARRRLQHFQHGADFIVGGSGGPDSQLVAFAATPGERVQVTPQGQAGGGINITIPISGVGGGVTEAQVEAIAQRHAQNLVNELEAMISS